MIDPVTNLVEIVRIENTKSDHVTRHFVNTWLSRYPLPEKVVSDNGSEFKGAEWEFNALDWGIKKVRISSYTPTANGIIESVHRAMGQILRTVVENKQPQTKAELDLLVDDALAQTLRACRCAANTSLQGIAPGALVFGRDMNMNIPIVADIISISQNRQLQTDLRLMRENSRRTRHEYTVGQLAYINNHHDSSDKMKPAWKGPFPIIQVHTNGTVTLQRGQIHERVSIRQIKPSA
jgi:transposase InsO family protein